MRAQHGRELMGCKSPVGVLTWTHREQDNYKPKARAKSRGIVRRKPECKRCEATDCKPHSQGRGMLLAVSPCSDVSRETAEVSRGHLVLQCLTRVAEHEGPNMRSRAEQ